jgi:hypothetical protein
VSYHTVQTTGSDHKEGAVIQMVQETLKRMEVAGINANNRKKKTDQ